ncbi:MAG TPA: hypothetical protein VKY57_16135 [Chitinispirillaceae bacterium]|nr:hypothetical protein [Chitinispirillaceae bacterium]
MKKSLLIFLFLAATVSVDASNLANPAVAFPKARISVGGAYHLGGYTITNKEIAAIFNRFTARIEYTPLSFLGIGLNLGATQIEVDRYITGLDTVAVFHGKYGFTGGAHLKISSPLFFNDLFRITSIVQATMFSSKSRFDAHYRGYDGTGIIGIQAYIPKFGYITAGPQLYLIHGYNKSYNGKENFYSNINNLRGWISVDYIPRINEIKENKFFISLEFSASPAINYTKKVPIQEYSISVSIGSITKQLYGIKSDVDWNP